MMRKVILYFVLVFSVMTIFISAFSNIASAKEEYIEQKYLAEPIYAKTNSSIRIDWAQAYIENPAIEKYRSQIQYITIIDDYGEIGRYTTHDTYFDLPSLPASDSSYIAFVGGSYEKQNSFAIFRIYVDEQSNAVEYPMVVLNTTNEYDLTFSTSDDVIIDFASSYEDESNEAKWWRDNYFHSIQMRKTDDFSDYNGYIKKFNNTYTWGETFFADDIDTGWQFVAGIEQIASGQTSYNLGQLSEGKYIYIVCSDLGMQNGMIIAKYNITIIEESYTQPIQTTEQNIDVMVNGISLQFDVPPQIINDRTMIPLRAVFEALGAEVEWDEATQTVTAQKKYSQTNGMLFVKFQIGSNIMINSFTPGTHTIDSPPVIVDGRTLIPVRAAAEAFGYDVEWNGDTREVIITGK